MKRILCFGIWIVYSLLLSRGSAQPAEENTASFGDQMVFGVISERDFELNPFQIKSPLEEEIIQMIFGYGLTKRADKVLNPQSLIERSIASRDNRVWRMTLERNINFHNGSNLRNVDVQFTFELLKKYGGCNLNRQLDFSNLKSVSGNGDLEVVFELHEPDKEFGNKLADIPIISSVYYAPAMEKGYAVFRQQRPMGMGPFRFETRREDTIMLSYSPFYYKGRPFLDRVKISFFPDEQTLIDALVIGEVDYLELPDLNMARSLVDLLGTRMAVFGIPRTEIKFSSLLFNLNRFPLSEPEVREAVYRSINRRQIVERYLKDTGSLANTMLKESNPYYERSLYGDDYNPEEALALLRRNGWRLNSQNLLQKNGRPLTFKLYFSRNSELETEIARAITIDLAELHINVQPEPVLLRDKPGLIAESDYQTMLYAYSYDPQYIPEAIEEFYGKVLGATQKVPNYQNYYITDLLELIKAKRSLQKNLYKRFQTFIREDMPAVFLYFDDRIIVGLDKRFQDSRATFKDQDYFYYRMNPIENWFVPREKQKYP